MAAAATAPATAADNKAAAVTPTPRNSVNAVNTGGGAGGVAARRSKAKAVSLSDQPEGEVSYAAEPSPADGHATFGSADKDLNEHWDKAAKQAQADAAPKK